MLHPVIDTVRGDYYRRLISIGVDRDIVREYLRSQPTILEDPSSPIEYQVGNYSIPYHDPIFPVNRPNKDPLRGLSDNQIRRIDDMIDQGLREIVQLTVNPPSGPYDTVSTGSLTTTIRVSGMEHLPSPGENQPDILGILNNPEGAEITSTITSERLSNILISNSNVDPESTLHAINERYNIIRDIYSASGEEDSYRLDDRFLASMSGEINSIFDASISPAMFSELSGFFSEPIDSSLRRRGLVVMRPQNDLLLGRQLFSWIERELRSVSTLKVSAYVDPLVNPELYLLLINSRYQKSVVNVPIQDTSDIIYSTIELAR